MHTILIQTILHLPDPLDPQAWEAVEACASAVLAPNPFYHLHPLHPDATDCEPPFQLNHFRVLLPNGRDITDELSDFDHDRIRLELQEAYTERVTSQQ